MTVYCGLTRAELVERLKALEDKNALNELQQAERTIERRRAQAALRDSEERLRAILETAVEGIITIDERGIIESFNTASEKIFGYKAAEIVGQNVNLLMPAPYRHEHDKYIARYRKTGRAKIIGIGREVLGRRKDGTTFPMDLAVSEVRLVDRRLFTGFVRDITDRKRLEKEILEISDAEQRRIGQGLHDGLCQQLAGIQLMGEVLAKNLSKKSKAEGAQAAKIAEHVREAISQTRLLARGLSPVSLETNGLMSALQELVAAVARLFSVECRFQCGEPVLLRDNAVATHLYRIAQEAINNAIRHGKARTVVVTLTRQKSDACLIVTDNGIGFPKELKNDSGMGLRIMKYRAGMIGASLEIRSGNGDGTRVACTFKNNL
jgi:two-component system, LuxR family, sensor kinase FixL